MEKEKTHKRNWGIWSQSFTCHMQSYLPVTLYRIAITCWSATEYKLCNMELPNTRAPTTSCALSLIYVTVLTEWHCKLWSIDLLGASLQLSDIRTYVAILMIIFCYFHCYPIKFNIVAIWEFRFTTALTMQNTAPRVHCTGYQPRTKDDPLLPRKGNRPNMCENTFF